MHWMTMMMMMMTRAIYMQCIFQGFELVIGCLGGQHLLGNFC